MEDALYQRKRKELITSPKISVAIPLYNEQDGLDELYRRVRRMLRDIEGGPHQIVLVNDGSSDGTDEILSAIASIDPDVTVISLSRNFGHQAAVSAALDHVIGDVTVVMDGDLQDTPESIPRLLDKYHQGYDVVYAIRKNRKEGILLRACYSLFYSIVTKLSEIPLPPDAGDFALLSRRVVNELRRHREYHRYIRGLRSWVGFRQTGIEVERDPRYAGRSKYNTRALFRLAADGIFSFSLVPLRAAFILGAFAIATAMLFCVYSIWAKIAWDQSPQGFTTMIVAGIFLSGLQLLFLGIIGEYVGRIYQQVKQRKTYIVDSAINVPEQHPRLGNFTDTVADAKNMTFEKV